MKIKVMSVGPGWKSEEVGSFTRSFDNERAFGNFAVCRVRVGGKRFSRISCETELLVWPTHPATADGDDTVKFYDACLAQVRKGN